jgi:hypothetical protein
LGCTGRTCKPVSGCAGNSSSRVKCSVNEPLAVDKAALVLGLHENAELVCRHGRIVRLVQSRATLARAGPRARSPVTRATAGWRPLTLTASDAVCTSGLSPVTSTAGHASDEDRGSASQNTGSERRRRQDGRRALDGLEVDVNQRAERRHHRVTRAAFPAWRLRGVSVVGRRDAEGVSALPLAFEPLRTGDSRRERAPSRPISQERGA